MKSISDRLADIQNSLWMLDRSKDTTTLAEMAQTIMSIHSDVGGVVYDLMTAEALDKEKLAEYCRVHSSRMEKEGHTKTGLVLQWAAHRIEMDAVKSEDQS